MADDTNRGIKITSENHGVTTNSFVDLFFKHNSSYSLDDRAYKAYSVIDDNTFFVERPMYTGFLSYYEGSHNRLRKINYKFRQHGKCS